MQNHHVLLSHNSETEEAIIISPLASPIVYPNTIHLPLDTTTKLVPLPAPPLFVIDSSTSNMPQTTIQTIQVQVPVVPPIRPTTTSSQQTPTTPKTTTTTIRNTNSNNNSSTMKRPIRASLSSLEKLESNHLGVLEGTLQEIKKTTSNGSGSSNSNERHHRRKRNLKSPTEWSMNSSIPENGSLSDLRQELDKAESVYSRRTADATFGDDFSSSDDEGIVGGFLPIPSFEEYKYDDPAAPLTNHVPSPMRVNDPRTISESTLPEITTTTTTNIATPQSQSQAGSFVFQAHNNNNSSSHLSFPHTMETVSEEVHNGLNNNKNNNNNNNYNKGKTIISVTPSKTKQPEDESTQETSPDSSNNAVPFEVFVPKGSSGSTSGIRTVLSTTTFEADSVPPSTPQQRDRLTTTAEPTTPVNARGWATVAEARPSYTAPRPTFRRHSSVSVMGHSPAASYLKSAQSPVHELVKKQERKRLHLKATIDSVRSKNYTVDSRLLSALTEKENLKRDMQQERIAHQQTVTSLEHKMKFLQRQHELQTEQQEGVNGLTKTHNKFLKEQLDQLQEEYERLQRQHKKELARQAEKPEELYDQIQRLEKSKKLLQEQQQQELTAKQMEYESLESKLKNAQEQHLRHEQSLQEDLQEEQHKIKKLQDRVVELETVELTIANQKILLLTNQLEDARQDKLLQTSQHRALLEQTETKHAAMMQQHATVTQAKDQEILALSHQVSELQATKERLESLRAKEVQEGRQLLKEQLADSLLQQEESNQQKLVIQSNYAQLRMELQTVQQERDTLLQTQQEQAQVQEQTKTLFGKKVSRLEEECTRLQSTLDLELGQQTCEIEKLVGKLEMAEQEWHEQQATNQKLQETVEALQQEQDLLKQAHKAELETAAHANVTLARNLLKDLAFGL